MTLTIKNFTKYYPKQIDPTLYQLSLTLEPNTIYGLVGRNGVGKTTLMNCILNRVITKGGEAFLDHSPLWDNQSLLSQCYLANQHDAFEINTTITQILTLYQNIYTQFDAELFQEMITAFKLNVDAKVKTFSTGQRQIVQMGLALCVDANYVFLDEPVSGLDAYNRELFYQFIIKAYTKRPRTFVIATHLINEISHLIEHLIVLKNAKTLLTFDKERLLETSHLVNCPIEHLSTLTQKYHTVVLEQNEQFTQIVILDEPSIEHHDFVTLLPLDLQHLFIALTKE